MKKLTIEQVKRYKRIYDLIGHLGEEYDLLYELYQEMGKEIQTTMEESGDSVQIVGEYKLTLKSFQYPQVEEMCIDDFIELEKNSWKYRIIEELDLSTRATNCLRRAGIRTVGELLDYTEMDIAKIKNCGRETLREIVNKLAELGLFLKEW